MTSRGFTLLEVLVALTILGIAIVTLMQLSSQGLRLLHLAENGLSAGRPGGGPLVRTTDALQEGVDTGREGPFQWERRVGLVAMPERSPRVPAHGPAS